ncbi:plastocyanin/azurin family copper-binding protein [Paenibacillus sp. ATY16]|uniref:plastocyanin/azurin family copper-binding protein n=1 Tax=Paenibacillus sp. ATY16 TaxID=1759312 RepID=UPI00200CDD18|nr:plastocyanin/azurin family copper-binding protein [Paenibacillus sp. ATY16]MCK9859766.1 cupredoxin domain-containing protein [Paenibacillus sp. ATY16]
MTTKKLTMFMFAAVLLTSLLSSVIGASAAETQPPSVTTDAESAAKLGLLLGDGSGVNETYLAKQTTRMQAAIISLRLNGHLKEAMAGTGSSSFKDADKAGKSNVPILAYLKQHPELGWAGNPDGSFHPNDPVSAQQLYKVLLENIGFRSGSEFAYADTLTFAASKGMASIAAASPLTNAHLATALIEALTVQTPQGQTFFVNLQQKGVLPQSAALPQGKRIQLRSHQKLGAYLTDSNGMTLYYFTKDAENINACGGQCLVNWPVFTSDELQIPAFLNKADFSSITRADGTEQWTYKGYPLYYFIKDAQSGDVLGQNVNQVWFVINPSTFKGMTPEAKTYRIDIKQFSFGTEPLTVEAGSKITFTNLDEMEHNAVAVDGSFKVPVLKTGESYTITLDKPGTYNYYCELHKSFMTGQIIVK